MKRLLPSNAEFITLWNSSESVVSFANLIGVTKSHASSAACILRKSGFPLKRFGVSSICVTCENCGSTFRAYLSAIKSGGGKYCSRKCSAKFAWKTRNSHGESKTRLYNIWCHMKTRCLCSTSAAYRYYGGRGINVCQEWIESYESFRNWAVESGYRDDLEIDRRDTNGNYEPGNCRWATRVEQMRNTRKKANAVTSKYKGVSWSKKSKKWIVQVCSPGRPLCRGRFVSELDAANEYDRIVRIEFGEYAMTNFKEENNAGFKQEKR